jgi:hypothetical protein
MRIGLVGWLGGALILGMGSTVQAQVSVGVVIGRPAPVVVEEPAPPVVEVEAPPPVVIEAPPPPRVYRVAPRPGPEFVWVEGYWFPQGRRYSWHNGYWTRPPYAGAFWVEPYYARGAYVAGYWSGAHGRFDHDHRWDRERDRDRREVQHEDRRDRHDDR